jgi:hypothetical protein
MLVKRAAVLALGLVMGASAAAARPMTDAEVRHEIIRESIANYHGACPCPYTQIHNKRDPVVRRCGASSEYHRPGATIQCYEHDVSDTDVEAWRNDHDPRR